MINNIIKKKVERNQPRKPNLIILLLLLFTFNNFIIIIFFSIRKSKFKERFYQCFENWTIGRTANRRSLWSGLLPKTVFLLNWWYWTAQAGNWTVELVKLKTGPIFLLLWKPYGDGEAQKTKKPKNHLIPTNKSPKRLQPPKAQSIWRPAK